MDLESRSAFWAASMLPSPVGGLVPSINQIPCILYYRLIVETYVGRNSSGL